MIGRAGRLLMIGVVGWLAAPVVAVEPTAAWPTLPPLPVGPFVVLAEGGMRAGTPITIDDTHVVLDSPASGVIRLPRRSVAGFRASLAVGPASVPRGGPRAATAITFTNGDAVVATNVSLRDGEVRFTPERGPAPTVAAALARVLALDLPAAARASSRNRTWVALDDGSRFVSDAPPPRDTDGIVATIAEGDGLRFLSSLEPHEPAAVQPAWPTARGATAFTACHLHAPARVRYRLAKPAARFRAGVAIDDSAGQGGSVVVTIRGRGDGERGDAFTSAVIRGGDEPLQLDVPLGGARELELVVDPADVGTVLDRTIWLDPRIEFQ